MVLLSIRGEPREYNGLGGLLLMSLVKKRGELRNSNFQSNCCLNDLRGSWSLSTRAAGLKLLEIKHRTSSCHWLINQLDSKASWSVSFSGYLLVFLFVCCRWASLPGGSLVRNLSARLETLVPSLVLGDSSFPRASKQLRVGFLSTMTSGNSECSPLDHQGNSCLLLLLLLAYSIYDIELIYFY